MTCNKNAYINTGIAIRYVYVCVCNRKMESLLNETRVTSGLRCYTRVEKTITKYYGKKY